MPRTNAYALVFTSVFFLLCYAQITPISTARNLGAVLEIIQQKGLHSPSQKKLFGVAVSAMAESHDQHSSYIPPTTSDRYLRVLDQELSGIGISVKKDASTEDLFVQTPIIGQPHPAYDAGMRTGDQIISVAGKPVRGHRLAGSTAEADGLAQELLLHRVGHLAGLALGRSGRGLRLLSLRREKVGAGTVRRSEHSTDGC